MIRILDRYILQTFLFSLLIVLAAMMALALLLDIAVNVNKFLDLSSKSQAVSYWALMGSILNYYFYKAFDYFQVLAAPSLLVAAAASMVRLNRTRELTGMKAAGISLYRIMWPMIAISLILDGFYVINQEVLLPSMAVQLSRDPEDLSSRESFPVEFIRDEHNNILYAPDYNPRAQQMLPIALSKCPHCQQIYTENTASTVLTCPHCAKPIAPAEVREIFRANVLIFLRDSEYQARGTIEAERATWDERAHGWRLKNGLRLPPIKEPALLDRIPTGPEGDRVDFYSSNVGPDEIQRHRASDFHRYMSYPELKTLAEDPMRGNRRQMQVALHQHVTAPILNILLLLLGLPFVAGRDDRNYFVSIGLAFGLAIGVFSITFAATAFGNAGHLRPLLAAWLPVFIVLPASILSMEATRT